MPEPHNVRPEMPKKPKDQQAKAIARVRRAFRATCHTQLDAYLSEPDEQSGLPLIDVLIAYAGQGWGVSVGVSLQEPEQQTSVEERAAESGIEIVSA